MTLGKALEFSGLKYSPLEKKEGDLVSQALLSIRTTEKPLTNTVAGYPPEIAIHFVWRTTQVLGLL